MKKNSKKNFVILLLLGIAFVSIIIIQIRMNPKMIGTTDESKKYSKLPKLNEQTISKLSENDLILYKILNSIDFFSTAEGNFESTNKTINSDVKSDFAVDIKNRKNFVSYSDISYGDNATVIIDNNKKIDFDETQKTYREFEYKVPSKDNIIKWLYPKDRYDSNGNLVERQEGILLLHDSDVLFNQSSVGTNLSKKFSNWNLDGEGKYLGRDCVKIKGKLNNNGEFGECAFEVWVDKNTGIIMKFDQMDDNNQVVLETIINKIKIDEPINPNVFTKDTTKYKKK